MGKHSIPCSPLAAGSCPSLLQPNPSPTCNSRNANLQQMGNATTFQSLLLHRVSRFALQQLYSCSAIFPLSCTVSFPSILPITKFYLARDVQTSTWGWSITYRAQLRVVPRESGQLEELKLITREIEQHCSHLSLPQISITEPAAGLRQRPRCVYKEMMPKDFQAETCTAPQRQDFVPFLS